MAKFEAAPYCEECWDRLNPARTPGRLKQPEPESCHVCGMPTMSGIYVRTDLEAHPATPPRSV